MEKLRIVGQNITLSVGEQEWLKHMQGVFGCPESVALEEIIKYKKELAFSYEKEGNYALARQLLMDIDEWDDTREEEFKNRAQHSDKKIILLGD